MEPVSPITSLSAREQQHMLLLFMPMKKLGGAKALQTVSDLQLKLTENAKDNRAATGVHFSMFYYLPSGTTPKLPVPSFQTAEGKDLLVVQALYDADFKPYIDSFVNDPDIAGGLNSILEHMDESGIVKDTDPTSAKYIIENGKVEENPNEFYCLLMRYNFADPTIPAAAKITSLNKYLLTHTFPGLTIEKILDNYPDARVLWPSKAPAIKFAESKKPVCK
jgi:hypothetical protein